MLEKRLNDFLKIDPIQIIRKLLSDRDILDWIEVANRKQLLKGKNSLDIKLSDIGGGYSDVTLSLHPEKKRDRVNLYDTGEFHESITARYKYTYLELTSDPIKEDENGNITNLYDEWGADIIGLNETNFNKLIRTLKDKLLREIYSQI